LSVVGLSLDSKAVFSPATVAAGSGTTTVTLQVQLPGSAALERPARPFASGSLPLAFCLILLPFSGRLRKGARRWKNLALLALVGAVLTVGLNGCGGSSSLKAQSYSLTVTAAAGSLSHSTALKLTVQ
jgi:predicted permease